MLRIVLAVLSIIVFIAATGYALVFSEPRAFIPGVVLAVFSLVQTVPWLWDRYLQRDPDAPRRTPANAGAGTVADYLNGRKRKFEDEQSRFIPLAGKSEITPQYTTEIDSQIETFDDIGEAVRRYNGRFVLIGDPGAGKSMALQHLMMDAIASWENPLKNDRVPVWINLGLSANPIDVDQMLDYWWHEQCFLPDSPEKYIRQENLKLFLDGLNEMPLETRKQRGQALREWIAAHPDLPIIVTCRVRDYEDDPDLRLSDLPVVYVLPLDEARSRAMIARYGGAQDLWDRIDKDDALRRLANNPYNLVMLVDVSKQPPFALPANLNDLYRRYMEVTYERYTQQRTQLADAETPLLRLKLPQLERQLRLLAGWMLMRRDGKAGLTAGYDETRRKIGLAALRDGINLGVLLREGDNIRFFHQSLQGYFAIQPLSRALKVNNRFERLTKNPVALIRQIGDLGDAGTPAIEPLIAALRDEDGYVRYAAAVALGNIRDARAVEPLIAALLDEDKDVCLSAAQALGEIGDARAVEPLIAALRNGNWRISRAVVEALGKIGDARAVEPLIAALRNPPGYFNDKDVRSAVAEALGKIGTSAVVPLIFALRDSVSFVRSAASDVLGKLRDARAVEPLIAALGDKDWTVRSAAAAALGKIGDARAVEPLIAALQDSDRWIRTAAAYALREIGDPRVVEPLIAALDDKDWTVRSAAAHALGKIGDAHALEPLIAALGDKDWTVRSAAAWALGKIGDARAVEPLIPALRDEAERVRSAAATALTQFRDHPAAREALENEGLQ